MSVLCVHGGMKTYALNVSYLTFASSIALPLVTGFVTKLRAHARVKSATLVVLAVLSGLAQTLIAKHGVIVFKSFADNSISTFVLAYIMHAGILKPSGLSDKVQAATPDFGIGAPVVSTDVPVVEVSVPTDTAAPDVDPEIADLAHRLGVA